MTASSCWVARVAGTWGVRPRAFRSRPTFPLWCRTPNSWAISAATQDVPPYTVMGGNPTAVVKRRFSTEVVAELLAIRWWDWPAETVTRLLPAIVGADLDALRKAA
jgi:hypothetical protein